MGKKKKNHKKNNCPCCEIGEVLDNLMLQHGQFIEVLENNVIEQDLLPVVDMLEDCFSLMNRANIKLLQTLGEEIFLVNNRI